MLDLKPHRQQTGRELTRCRDEMNSPFNRFFDMDTPGSRRFFGDGQWTPRLDVLEGSEARKIVVKTG